jgi:hypothetical protein
VQWCSAHLASLGAIAIPRSAYLVRLADALQTPLSRRVPRKKNTHAPT